MLKAVKSSSSDEMQDEEKELDPEAVKSCCSTFYENELVAKILGENFHPGGEKLTLHLGAKLGLNENSLVLDVACGPGASALSLAKQFGCRVIGIDLSEKNLEKAREKAASDSVSEKLEFIRSDAEKLEFDDDKFDAVICECALCTFPDKKIAMDEMFRTLKPGGFVGITDVTLENELPANLKDIIFRVVCIAGALPATGYQKLLNDAGFCNVQFEDHSYTIQELMDKVGKVIQGWEVIKQICDCDFEQSLGINLTPEKARELLKMGYSELEENNIGYGLFTGSSK